jgi:HIV Tat-specific factor 1
LAPQLDQSLLEEQSKAYRVEGVDEDAPAAAQKKRKKQHVNGEEVRSAIPAAVEAGAIYLTERHVQDQPSQKPKKARINTAVYVTSLPSDSTLEEISSVFSKCGVIAEEIDRGQPRIKMYENEKGQFKGDALIVYFRPESVNLAIQMLDDTSLRFGNVEKMKVQAADFSYKSQQEAPPKSSKRDQKKVIRKTQKLNK